MSDPINYATGWYSISPAFAWWNFDAHRMAEIKARREAARTIEKIKQEEKADRTGIQVRQGSIDIYAQQTQQPFPEEKEMKHILLGAAVLNSVLGMYNILYASLAWSIFNFIAAAVCLYSYLDTGE